MYKHKVIYFCDPFFSIGIKSEKQEYNTLIKNRLETKDIKFKNVKCTTDSMVIGEMCDVFFFDWGGMSIGKSCLNHFARVILQNAIDRPNTYYVTTLMFTGMAMKDAIEEFGAKRPVNLLLDIDSFCELFKKLEAEVTS